MSFSTRLSKLVIAEERCSTLVWNLGYFTIFVKNQSSILSLRSATQMSVPSESTNQSTPVIRYMQIAELDFVVDALSAKIPTLVISSA